MFGYFMSSFWNKGYTVQCLCVSFARKHMRLSVRPSHSGIVNVT